MSSGARSHSSAADFNPLAPDGSYTLNLAEHVDRAVAMQVGYACLPGWRRCGGAVCLYMRGI